ncbi:CCH RNA binding domain protein [Cryptosporidium canis]|uniref:CCH RNA binding domain protein n=1 Tax=Cryptosporidium canis TaxID=195482 RepID=A0ABQ8P4U6_9CRYT|nr:CCH RNA binding domain protein [Cryptosporidium canis]KAJ1609891.1 CCH RNA binding domain protein [Cryptosporidium canis]
MACPRLLSDSDLCRFRTKPCRRSKQMGCDFGIARCQYSHNIYWPRRCPFYLSNQSTIRYIPVLCPDIIIKEDESSISHCNRGGGCPFAHSYEEINYHPLMYKTKICEQFQRGDCNTYYCHLIHGLAERRESKVYLLPYTQNVQVPNYPGVVVASRYNKGLQGSSQTGHQSQRALSNNENICNNQTGGPGRRANLDQLIPDKWSERIFSQSGGNDEFWRTAEKDEVGTLGNSSKSEAENKGRLRTSELDSKTTAQGLHLAKQGKSAQEKMRDEDIINVFRAFVLEDEILSNSSEGCKAPKMAPTLPNSKIQHLKATNENILPHSHGKSFKTIVSEADSNKNNENSNTNNFFLTN